MGLAHSPRIVTDGLVLCLDAANSKGYDRFENLALNSEAINSWANNGNAISVSANSQIAPNGTSTADTLAQTAVTGASRWVSSTTRTYTAGITYTLSIWLKKISGTQAQPTINLWVNGGTNQSVGTITTEWIRYSKSFTPSSTISSNTFSGLNIGWSDSGGANDFVFAAWGFQIEIGSSATDYYRTTSTTKSRGTIWGDLSGNGNNGTLTNGPTYSSANGGSIVFDGVNDYVNSSYDLSWNNTNSVTINFFIKPSSLTGYYPFLGKGPSNWEWQFLQNNTSLQFVYWNTAGGHTNGPIPNISDIFISLNEWICIDMVWNHNENKLYFYKNSILVNTTVWIDASINQNRSDGIKIGGEIYQWGSQGRYWNGTFSSLKVYNRALTAQEIQQNFNALRGRYSI